MYKRQTEYKAKIDNVLFECFGQALINLLMNRSGTSVIFVCIFFDFHSTFPDLICLVSAILRSKFGKMKYAATPKIKVAIQANITPISPRNAVAAINPINKNLMMRSFAVCFFFTSNSEYESFIFCSSY